MSRRRREGPPPVKWGLPLTEAEKTALTHMAIEAGIGVGQAAANILRAALPVLRGTILDPEWIQIGSKLDPDWIQNGHGNGQNARTRRLARLATRAKKISPDLDPDLLRQEETASRTREGGVGGGVDVAPGPAVPEVFTDPEPVRRRRPTKPGKLPEHKDSLAPDALVALWRESGLPYENADVLASRCYPAWAQEEAIRATQVRHLRAPLEEPARYALRVMEGKYAAAKAEERTLRPLPPLVKAEDEAPWTPEERERKRQFQELMQKTIAQMGGDKA